MPRPISATVSVPSLRHNLDVVVQTLNHTAVASGIPRPRIWAVIKANAYGHGIEPAIQAFQAADGLALLDLEETIRCREAGWTRPLLMLEGFFEPSDLDVAAAHGLSVVIHTHEQLRMLELWRTQQPRLDALVKLNTGMNRLGFSPDDFPSAYNRALELQGRGILGSVGKMTHFARADDDMDATLAQIDCFKRVAMPFPGAISVCNSAATLSPGLAAHLPSAPEQWVRPGICLYGGSPFVSPDAAQLGLRPGMTLAAELLATRELRPGEGVGYGHTYVADKAMRIGIVACGYADGYPRHAGTGTPVSVDGVRTRLVGRVSMDMLAVDLDPVPQARAGSRVVLFGHGGPRVDEVAAAAGTLGYELLCAVAPRVPRHVQE